MKLTPGAMIVAMVYGLEIMPGLCYVAQPRSLSGAHGALVSGSL